MKIGFLLPRYGPAAFGGAEVAARAFAERLAARAGITCEVFTTGATDAATWRDELAAGTTVEGGVTVHRFHSRLGRGNDFAARNAALLDGGAALDADAAWRWVESLGPVCPDAVDAAVASACDVVTVHPYLYHPCVTGVAALGRRSVLHPATHDEPAIHLPIYGPMFERAGALAFWSDEECATTHRLFPSTVTHHQLVAGIGVELDAGTGVDLDVDLDAAPAPRSVDAIGGRPYVLCLGKVLAAKGCRALAESFRVYKSRHPGDAALVFAGSVVDPIDPSDDVIVLGPVDEATKAELLAYCALLVTASPYESLSLVLLEAWAAARPVLVNGACDVTRGHCERHGGGLWFVDYATFEATLDRLLTDHELNRAMGAAGRAAVAEHYTWDSVLDRYLSFLAKL